ncbi:MAG: DNA polymerase IV [Clostridia bacterium]|nr:DNA polymerase IV [Clostridia bacterium]
MVLAKNEHAKRYGITTAETVWQAKRKCPELVLVPPHYDRYEEFYRRINALYCEYTDRVEPFSIDESWLDVTGSRLLFGDGKQIADTLRRRVKEELGITISVGVSFNKTLAKMGSDYKKPDATTVFSKENYQSILYPLPVGELIFAGRSTCETLARMGIHTIGDLAHADRACVVSAIGKIGGQLHDYANGIDPTPVRLFTDKREIKSCGNGMTFPQDLTTEEQLHNGLLYLTEPVAARLRTHGLFCKTIHVTVKYPSLKTVSHQRALGTPTAVTSALYEGALQALHDCWQEGTAVRSLTVTACNLCEDELPEQLDLFVENDEKRERQATLDTAVDTLRDRFGNDAVKRCAILHKSVGRPHEK